MLTLRCPKHPGYKAIKHPRVKCEPCWFMYYLRIFCSLSEVAAKVGA